MLGMVDVCVKLVLVFEMSDENEVCGAAAGAVHFRVRDGCNDFLKLFVAVEEQLNVLLLGFAVCAVKQLPHNDVMKHGAEHLRCKVISYFMTGRQIKTGTTTPSLRKKLVRAFSPPLAPSFVAAFAALGVSFPGACPGKDVFLF